MAKAYRLFDGHWSTPTLNVLGEKIADMEETVYGRNCGVIGADAGPCPLIGILNRDNQAGAIIHVLGGLVSQNVHPYPYDLEHLLVRDPNLFDGAEAIVCMDKATPPLDDVADRIRYCRTIVRRIKKLIPNTRQLMRGSNGKSLRIDTTLLTIRVFDEHDKVLFES